MTEAGARNFQRRVVPVDTFLIVNSLLVPDRPPNLLALLRATTS